MRATPKPGRNDPCPCMSGKKYKTCCLLKKAVIDRTPPNNQELNGAAPFEVIPGTKRATMKSVVWKGKRLRIIWNEIHYRPLTETFHEFLIGVIGRTFGEQWIAQQNSLETEKRHIVANWLAEFQMLGEETPLRIDRGVYALSGPMAALLSLGYDLWFLQLDYKLPTSWVERLRDPNQFQGARYEVAIASIFVRADFVLTLLDEKVKGQKHCEFIAKHKTIGIEVYVEAKSRVRRGVLNQAGEFNEETDVKGDIRGLYQSALTQAPNDKPFFIFVDVNLPTDQLPAPDDEAYSIPYDKIPWMAEVEKILKDDWGIEGRGPSPAQSSSSCGASAGVGRALLSRGRPCPASPPREVADFAFGSPDRNTERP
jgi:hypothetical protein